MYKFVRTALVAAVLVTGVVSAGAQDTVDTQKLDYVAKAVEKTLAATSLHIESQSKTELSGAPQGANFGQEQAETADLAKIDQGWDASGTRSMTITLPNGQTKITTEYVVTGGKAYLRFTDVPDTLRSSVPSDWTDAETLAQQANAQGGGQAAGLGTGFDSATLSTTPLGALNLPFDSKSVTALQELAADTIDGQSMRVFQVTMDSAAVLASSGASLLSPGFGMGMGGGGFPGAQGGFPGGQDQMTPPAGAPALGTPPADLGTPNPEDAKITFAVYVGDQDGLVHRIYSVVTVNAGAGSGQPFGLNMTTITNFSKFNEPVTITAPKPASS
jgi:hypothetical protein